MRSQSLPNVRAPVELGVQNGARRDNAGCRPGFIHAHNLVAFIACALHVSLRQRCRKVAGGLTPRAVLEKFSAMQMIDVHLPCTDGRKVILSRSRVSLR